MLEGQAHSLLLTIWTSRLNVVQSLRLPMQGGDQKVSLWKLPVAFDLVWVTCPSLLNRLRSA